MHIDEQTVREFYNILNHKQPTEIRVFDKNKYPNGKSVFVNNEEEFIKQVKIFNEKEKVDCHVGFRDRKGKTDKDIISSNLIFVDFDGDKAKENLEGFKKICKDNNIHIRLIGFSGGGYHCYIEHRLKDFDTPTERNNYKKDVLFKLRDYLIEKNIDIDKQVFNLSRVSRILGTFSYKRNKQTEIIENNKIDNLEKISNQLLYFITNIKESKKIKSTTHLSTEDLDFINNIVKQWKPGKRQELALAVGGYLRKEKRYGMDHIEKIIIEICNKADDQDIEERLAGVRYGYTRDEKDLVGYSILKKYNINPKTERDKIVLPGSGKLISKFAEEISDSIKNKNKLFYRIDAKGVYEVGYIQTKTNEEYTGFVEVKPNRFITLVEKYIDPIIILKDKKGYEYEIHKSMNKNQAEIVLASQYLHDKLPKIKRIFTVPIPIIYNNKLTFPKKGYDERFESWLDHDAPDINEDMNLEEAKKTIKYIFREFCFTDHQDYINAIAGLLTPFLRGLYSSFNVRTPVFFYIANRERAGKDYCAKISGYLYEGQALEEAPISNGESSDNNNELRKKILSALIAGRKRLHFSNNKGYINNSVFEGAVTAEKWGDRILGKNEHLDFDNELEFSLSGNTGIGYTADLANRSIFINLFLDIENANQRNFDTPDLHLWVINNRNKILSALYSLVKNWFNKECPKGSLPFTSFPEWAKVCGGIMESAGYDNPCNIQQEMLDIGGDTETNNMKKLFEHMYENHPEKWFYKKDIFDIMDNANILNNYNLKDRSDKIRFSKILIKFCGRLLSDIRLIRDSNSKASHNQKFMFTKQKHEKNTEKIFQDKL